MPEMASLSRNRHARDTGSHVCDPTMDAMPDSSTPYARVHRTQDGDDAVLTVGGALDVDTGALLVAEVLAAVESGTTRLEIDLQEIDSFDDAGAAALVRCRDAAGAIEGGLHYRTCSGGAGQDALLHAYADER
jgi:anti-anti-sigma regulatory factor